MATYLIVNTVWLLAAFAVSLRSRQIYRMRTWWLTLAILLVLTAIFDSIIVGLGIVTYDSELISGIRVGYAPIEDFAYTLAVCMLVPSLWIQLRKEKR